MQTVSNDMFKKEYAGVFNGDAEWQSIDSGSGATYSFSDESTYIQLPPFFDEKYCGNRGNIIDAPILALLGDSVTTDHISPAGKWLRFRGHQFRYSALCDLDAGVEHLYTVRKRRGGSVSQEGYAVGNVVASYVHGHWASNPLIARSFADACTEARR